MWKKYIIKALLLAIFLFLQTGFLPHFSLYGQVPNLIFAFFFIIAFFGQDKLGPYEIYCVIIFGTILDILISDIIGVSVLTFLIIALVLKRIQNILSEKNGKYPLSNFMILFLVFFIIFDLIIFKEFGLPTLFRTMYSFVSAIIGFFIYKKVNVQKIQSHKFGY